MSKKPVYKRVLIKLSGEALMGDRQYGLEPNTIKTIAEEIKEVHDFNVQIALMVGGGNIFRGVEGTAAGMDRSLADYMGMLATLINGLALQDALEKEGLITRLISAIEIKQIAEPFIPRRAIRHLEKGRVVIFVAGTGSPYFTTDTAAALRAVEIKAEVILKATKVDGIYDKDPLKEKDAKKFTQLKYFDILEKELKVMDATAISLCMDNKLPIIVFNLKNRGNIKKAILGEKIGTIVK